MTISSAASSIVLIALLLCAPSHAGEFTPSDLYDYEVVQFDNGFEAILNPRGASKTVSMRLVVGVGTNDFACKDEELPHLAEHLMYSGTSEFPEAALDSVVENWGGYWNASTDSTTTIYELDIYAPNIYEAIDLHYQMFTDSMLDDTKLASARDVVHAESGGSPSTLRTLLHRFGIGGNGTGRSYQGFVPGTRAYCEDIPDANHIDKNAVEEFLARYYVPLNMTLVVVGNFDRREMFETIARTFGTIENTAAGNKTRMIGELKAQGLKYHTTLEPFVSNETYVSLDFQVPRTYGLEKVALSLLGSYLESELFRLLRTELGWAYSPSVTIDNYADFSTLYLDAAVPTSLADQTFGVFADLIDSVRAHGVPEADLQIFKNGYFYSLVSAYETNADYTDFYTDMIDYYWISGSYPKIEELVLAVDTEVTRKVARQYLDLEQAMYFYKAPAVTYAGLAGILALILLAPVFFFVWRWQTGKSKKA